MYVIVFDQYCVSGHRLLENVGLGGRIHLNGTHERLLRSTEPALLPSLLICLVIYTSHVIVGSQKFLALYSPLLLEKIRGVTGSTIRLRRRGCQLRL